MTTQNPNRTRQLLRGSQQLAQRARGLSTNKITAVLIWLFGAWLTAQALGQLGAPDPFNTVAGLLIQWVLTKAESPLWRGRGYPPLALAATVVDAAVNSAGAWPYVTHLGATDFWTMIRDILHEPQAQPNTFTFVAVAVCIGLFVAGSAEYFWNLPD